MTTKNGREGGLEYTKTTDMRNQRLCETFLVHHGCLKTQGSMTEDAHLQKGIKQNCGSEEEVGQTNYNLWITINLGQVLVQWRIKSLFIRRLREWKILARVARRAGNHENAIKTKNKPCEWMLSDNVNN